MDRLLMFLKLNVCRSYHEEQAGIFEREARHPREEAGGAWSPSEQRNDQSFGLQLEDTVVCLRERVSCTYVSKSGM